MSTQWWRNLSFWVAVKMWEKFPRTDPRPEMLRNADNALRTLIKERGIAVSRIHYSAPFDRYARGIGLYLLYETDADLARFNADGTSAALEKRFREALLEGGFPPSQLKITTCTFASHETFMRDYQGNLYFLMK